MMSGVSRCICSAASTSSAPPAPGAAAAHCRPSSSAVPVTAEANARSSKLAGPREGRLAEAAVAGVVLAARGQQALAVRGERVAVGQEPLPVAGGRRRRHVLLVVRVVR